MAKTKDLHKIIASGKTVKAVEKKTERDLKSLTDKLSKAGISPEVTIDHTTRQITYEAKQGKEYDVAVSNFQIEGRDTPWETLNERAVAVANGGDLKNYTGQFVQSTYLELSSDQTDALKPSVPTARSMRPDPEDSFDYIRRFSL